MKDMDISTLINLSKEVIEYIKKDYYVFLDEEKKELLDNLDYQRLFNFLKDNRFPYFYIIYDVAYLNELDDDYIYLELVSFIILFLITSDIEDINPLKVALIKKEVCYLNNKYHISSLIKEDDSDLLIANLVCKLLDGLEYNIIFFDSDIEVFNYLCDELGIKVARFYSSIASKMKKKYLDSGIDPLSFDLDSNLKVNYDDIQDLILSYISEYRIN